MFLTCSRLVHNLFMTFSYIVHNLIHYLFWTVHDLHRTYSQVLTTYTWLVQDLFTNCSSLCTIFSQFFHALLRTYSFDHYFFMTCSQFVHKLFMTCWGLIHTTYEFMKSNKLNWLAGLSLAQLSPSLLYSICHIGLLLSL